MKNLFARCALAAVLNGLLVFIQPALAQGTAFTYQGRLDNGTNPANGNYDLTFSLYNAGSGGSQVGSTITNLDVGVSNGLFVVTNDFGSVFSGTAYWLQIGIRTNGGSGFTGLTPRQELTPTPYAVYAEIAGSNALILDPGTQNFFAGPLAGNETLTGSHNTGLGYDALAGSAGGDYNTAVGDSSLLANTSGGGNTAEGVFALWKNTAGNNNTAVGADAMAYNTNGSSNTALGQGALENNTSGSNNVILGALAMGNTTVDNGVVAIGYEALQNESAYNQGSVSGNGENTAIGYECLHEVGSGYGNTAVGYEALNQDTYGSYNTAMGDYALSNNATGFDNVAIGFAALQANTGYYNTAIGASALEANTVDIENTAIGTSALQQNSSGENNIAIGFEAGGSLTSGSDDIYIGNVGVNGESGIIRIGTPGTQTQAYIAGTFNCSILAITGGSDLAEPFEVSSPARDIPLGSVVVIDEEHTGHLKVSSRAYDTRVAGVLSGANGIHPGIEMQQQGLLEGGQNVALSGRVYALADAAYGPIQPGDLLTTSDTLGHAMKVKKHGKAQGAILGKAMSGLKQGRGMVLVLVALQ
ncbi:MAG: hypothetical protein ABSA83_00095 [Verrucomicrobiota bacterium]